MNGEEQIFFAQLYLFFSFCRHRRREKSPVYLDKLCWSFYVTKIFCITTISYPKLCLRHCACVLAAAVTKTFFITLETVTGDVNHGALTN